MDWLTAAVVVIVMGVGGFCRGFLRARHRDMMARRSYPHWETTIWLMPKETLSGTAPSDTDKTIADIVSRAGSDNR